MFISLTFIDTAARKFWDSTVNASQIRSFKAHSYHDGERLVEGTQITWIDTERSPSIVTAIPYQIAKAVGATDLRDASV